MKGARGSGTGLKMLVAVTAAGTMLIGLAVARSGALLSEPARRGVAALYAHLVFPTMVFRGVAAIKLEQIDPNVALLIALSKGIVAAACVGFGLAALSRTHGRAALAHAAAYAMAATHSFDVTFGAPLARELYPDSVGYVYLNQSVQLAVINPLLLVLMELGRTGDAAIGRTLGGVAANPLSCATLAGLLAGRLFPRGLPAALSALSAQVAEAGPFLGFLSLGFAMAALDATSARELQHTAVLCALKIVAMPALYLSVGKLLAVSAPPALIGFLGSLPASASIYSLALVNGLSPRVIGPLVPASMLLSVAFTLLPQRDDDGEAAARALRVAVGGGGVVCAGLAMLGRGKGAARRAKEE